ncbi:MAG: hypothetical protein PHT96_02160 [Syntrophorhabdaceae bacterium]|nr:hypothetical protein [Syntrophorhabdaceae bacterium]MDD4195199.1 hypothetical protein [Syntrophorhabdaceae bacterium]
MKAILAFILCISVFVPGYTCLAAEPDGFVTGQIIDSLEGKFKMLIGDKAFTNLGSRMGVIKGDILTIYSAADKAKSDPIGRCAVVQVNDTGSICEIIEMSREIGKDAVALKKVAYDDALLYPSLFTLLSKVVEPYPPEKKIKVYIYQIFDENHNVTEFSQKVRKEMVRVFFQKKRIVSAGRLISPALSAYLPGEYDEYNKTIEDYLRKDNIDVIISGAYKVMGDKVQISYYKIDKNYEDIIVDTVVASQPYTATAAKVVIPYTEKKKEQIIKCDVIFKPVQYRTQSRDERNEIVAAETRGNPVLEYTLRRSEFNIVMPVDFTLTVDGNTVKFDKSAELSIPLTTGEHQITASYSKGFYFNDTFLVALPEQNMVRKSAIISVDRPEDIVLEIEANPLPKRENLSFNVYRKTTRSSTIVKPVLTRETAKPVEVFKD